MFEQILIRLYHSNNMGVSEHQGVKVSLSFTRREHLQMYAALRTYHLHTSAFENRIYTYCKQAQDDLLLSRKLFWWVAIISIEQSTTCRNEAIYCEWLENLPLCIFEHDAVVDTSSTHWALNYRNCLNSYSHIWFSQSICYSINILICLFNFSVITNHN